MISLSLRASLSVLAATWFFFGPGPTISAQGVDCASTTCTAPTTCGVGCPVPAPFTVNAVTPISDLGPRFNGWPIGTFPDVGGGALGTLQKVELRATIAPAQVRYRVENLAATSAIVQAAQPIYDVRGFIDILDPQFPPPAAPVRIIQTSNKVGGFPLATDCLKWRVTDNAATLWGVSPNSLAPFDSCYDFNDPNPIPDPSPATPACPTLQGPCIIQPLDGSSCNCPPPFQLTPIPPLGGIRTRMGRSVNSIGSTCGPSVLDQNRSGYTDVRNYNGYNGSTLTTNVDDYTGTICWTDAAHLNLFKQSVSGAQKFIPFDTSAFILFPALSSSNLDQEGLVKMQVRLEIKYFYCPTPPTCNPDTANLCRTIGNMATINALANDASLFPLNCALLTGTGGLTQGTYGTTAWVNDASAVNALCNQKAIKYTLTSLPPAGVNTDTFNYTITNNAGCTSTCSVTVTIASPMCVVDPPVDLCRTAGTMININVLANDTSFRPLNCGLLTGVGGLTQGTYGTVAWVADAAAVNALCTGRAIKYTLNTLPPAGTNTDSFTYTITDTFGCTSTCTVTITIASPVCLPDTGNMCRTLATTATINVLANDTSFRPLNCGLLTGVGGLTRGLYGSVAWVNDATAVNALCNQRAVRYTLLNLPPAGVTTDTFTYTITDTLGCTSTCNVVVTIISPVCAPDTSEVCRTLSAFTNVNVLANDTSLRPLNCALLTGAGGLTQGTYGTTAWVADATAVNPLCNQRAIRYTLTTIPPGGVTQDTFSYTITDTFGCTSTCTVTINIASPVCAPDCRDICGTVGTMLTVNVLANDTSLRPLNCALLTGTGGLTQGTYGSVAWVTDASAVNALCNQKAVKYTLNTLPPAGVTMDMFTYTITDTNGCPSTCTVQIKICRIDAVNDTIMGCGNLPLRICILDNDISTCGALNCSNLSIVAQPANGSVQVVQDCANLPTDCCHSPLAGCTGCCLVYTPNTGFSGIETFTYRISMTSTACPGGTPITCTDTATVSVTIKPAPIAMDDMYELESNGMAGPFNVMLNDSPGTGCDTAGCGAPCSFVGCPVITEQPQFGTVMVLPDCTIKYTANPGVPFPGADSFRYCVRNNCDCCDDARVTITECPMIDRRQPGSLLIYPEFDNRPGRATYVTITNASCKWPNAGVWVEFIYIDKTNCIESNRTTFLTPCDTYTVLTSAHNPNPVRGFMYAFAKDALGRPISFNHLIGDLLILDGVDGYQYAVNPVSFRSPVPRGAFTDLDNDGIQDLNGLEYDPAPDVLLIPRFLGQDPPGEGGLVQDELVVLGLSGGLSFQTVLSFIGYNDNEIPFSVTKQFYCWEKWKLLEISNAFSNSYLKALGDDRLEIIGMTARESGWLRIDGLSAFSDAETIIDPAFYAFLVERQISSDRGAELPFELCTQGNGDLLPKNPFGDGPVPVVGDNQ